MSYLNSYSSAESKSNGIPGQVDLDQLAKSSNVKDGQNSTEWLKTWRRSLSSKTINTRVYHPEVLARAPVVHVAYQAARLAAPAQGVPGDAHYVAEVLAMAEILEVIGAPAILAQAASSETLTLRGHEIMTELQCDGLSQTKKNHPLCIAFSETMAQDIIHDVLSGTKTGRKLDRIYTLNENNIKVFPKIWKIVCDQVEFAAAPLLDIEEEKLKNTTCNQTQGISDYLNKFSTHFEFVQDARWTAQDRVAGSSMQRQQCKILNSNIGSETMYLINIKEFISQAILDTNHDIGAVIDLTEKWIASKIATGIDVYSRGVDQANLLASRACFNCGSESHDLTTCPVPRDEMKITRNREARRRSPPSTKGGKGGKGTGRGKKGGKGGKGSRGGKGGK